MEDLQQKALRDAAERHRTQKATKTDKIMEETTREVVAQAAAGAGEPDPTAQDPADIRRVMLQSFMKLGNTFLGAACGVWRSCAVLQRWKAASDAVQANEDEDEKEQQSKDAILLFFQCMNPHFSDIEKKDSSFMVVDEDRRFAGENDEGSLGEQYMKEVSLASKWRLASPQIRETCWQYLKMLSRYSTVYTIYEKVPPGMFSTMLKVAAKLNERREQGAMTLAEMTSKGLVSTGNQILDSVDPAEREEFMRALTDEESSEAIMAALQALVGGATTGGAGGMNLAQMIMQAKTLRK